MFLFPVDALPLPRMSELVMSVPCRDLDPDPQEYNLLCSLQVSSVRMQQGSLASGQGHTHWFFGEGVFFMGYALKIGRCALESKRMCSQY